MLRSPGPFPLLCGGLSRPRAGLCRAASHLPAAGAGFGSGCDPNAAVWSWESAGIQGFVTGTNGFLFEIPCMRRGGGGLEIGDPRGPFQSKPFCVSVIPVAEVRGKISRGLVYYCVKSKGGDCSIQRVLPLKGCYLESAGLLL